MMTATESFLLGVLVNAVWQVAAIALVAGACAAGARRARASARHVVWLLALAAAAVVPFASALPARSALPSPRTPPTAWPAVAAQSAASPDVSIPRPSTHKQLSMPPAVGRAILTAYAILVLLRIVGLWRALLATRAVRASAVTASMSPSMLRVAEECRQAIGIGPVVILASPDLEMPAVVGAWRPAIIVPPSALEVSPPELLRALLGHEMAHVRRRDFLLNLLCELLAAPLFFHPALAWIRRRVRHTREEACDALVTSGLMDGPRYAGALVAVARAFQSARHPAAALALFDDDSLEDRVMKVLHPSSRSVSASRAAVVLAAIVLALASGLASAGAVSVAPREDPRTPAPARTAGDAAMVARPDEEPRPGEYTYAAGAKRDPFMDLRVQPPRPTGHDPRAFLVQEIALRGVVKSAAGWTAMILGPDGRTYFVSVGQRFYDGTLSAVDAAGLTVQQQVRDPLAPARVRELRLALHPDRD